MTDGSKTYFMPETAETDIGPVVNEAFQIAGRTIRLMRPASPERLLELASVADAYAADQYMPYWAAFWPVAKYLAAVIIESDWAPGSRAIELGCGLGLPGVAALLSGLDVTFSDYDASALKFAAANANLNGFAKAKTLALDWRAPPQGRYDLVIASDLIYEERNLDPMVAFFEACLTDRGVALVADQNRPHAATFQQVVKARGFSINAREFKIDKRLGQEVSGTVYRIARLP